MGIRFLFGFLLIVAVDLYNLVLKHDEIRVSLFQSKRRLTFINETGDMR